MSGAIIYLVIVAVWAVVLVPRWLRSHDAPAADDTSGSEVREPVHGRVLARRARADSPSADTDPAAVDAHADRRAGGAVTDGHGVHGGRDGDGRDAPGDGAGGLGLSVGGGDVASDRGGRDGRGAGSDGGDVASDRGGRDGRGAGSDGGDVAADRAGASVGGRGDVAGGRDGDGRDTPGDVASGRGGRGGRAPRAGGGRRWRRARSYEPTARARRMALHRRVVFGLLLAVVAGTAGAAGYGFVPWWSVGAPALLLPLYVVHTRRVIVAEHSRRRRERRARELAAAEAVTETDHGDLAEPISVRTYRANKVAAGMRVIDREIVFDQHAAEPWQPQPVPLPTYLTAPAAPRAHQPTVSVDQYDEESAPVEEATVYDIRRAVGG